MKIGVIADTHIPKKAKKLPQVVLDIFNQVDLILHAGDVLDISILSTLEEIAPLHAVCGNNDSEELKLILPKKKIIVANGIKIGMVHGEGQKGTTRERAIKEFESDNVQCIVYGHSHIPYNSFENGILLFNPGSPTDRRRQPLFSVGILDVGDRIEGEIVYFR